MGDNIRISALTRCGSLSGDEFIPLTQESNNDGVLYTRYGTPVDIGEYILNHIYPAGIITPYGGIIVPTGWLICDGSPISKTNYARLYTAIGDQYGSTSTTFNVPNLKGRVPLGVCGVTSLSSVIGSEGPGPNTSLFVGASGGEFRHTLSASSLPPHAHSMVHFLYAYTTGSNPVPGTFPPTMSGEVSGDRGSKYTDNRIWNGISGPSSYNNGGGEVTAGGAHNNIQPYLAVNYIIKT